MAEGEGEADTFEPPLAFFHKPIAMVRICTAIGRISESGQRILLEHLLEPWELWSEPTSHHLKDQVMNASFS